MADKFDPYREALIVETTTIWPDEFDELELEDKWKMEKAIHADAANCANLEYLRMHTGFCRQITVTAEDVDRVRAGAT